MNRMGMQTIRLFNDEMKKLMIDFLLFSFTFVGMIGLDDSLKTAYFTISLIIFLIMEIFFALLQSNCLNAILSQSVIGICFLLFEDVGASHPAIKKYIYFVCIVLEIIWISHIICLFLSLFKKNDKIIKCIQYIKGYSILRANFNRYGTIPALFVFSFRYMLFKTTVFDFSTIMLVILILETILLIVYVSILFVQKKFLMKYANHNNIVFLNVKYLTTPYRLFSLENKLLFGNPYNLFSSQSMNLLGGVFHDDYYISQYSAINPNKRILKKYHLIVRINSSKYYSKNSLRKISRWLSFQEKIGTNIFIEDTAKKTNYKYEAPISCLLKRKYPYYYKENTIIFGNCWDLIIEGELKNHNNVNLNDIQSIFDECHKLMDIIDSGKTQYFSHYKNTLLGMDKAFLQDFYNLILIAEFMIHYEALMVLSGPNITDEDKNFLVSPALGDFINVINSDKTYPKELYNDVIKSARLLDCIAVRNGKSNIKTKEISRREILEVICKVRNRFVGHGTIIYAVSIEMVLALGHLVKLLLEEFLQLEDKHSLIDKYVFQTSNIPYLYKKHTVLFNGINKEGFCVFLDYITGYTLYPYEQEQYENESATISTLRFIE